jgi:hypothetical protein
MRFHHSIMAGPILNLCGGVNDVIRTSSETALHQPSAQVSASTHPSEQSTGICAAAHLPCPLILQVLAPNRGSLPTIAQMAQWNPMHMDGNGMLWRNDLLLQHGMHGFDTISLFGRPTAAVNAHRMHATDNIYLGGAAAQQVTFPLKSICVRCFRRDALGRDPCLHSFRRTPRYLH